MSFEPLRRQTLNFCCFSRSIATLHAGRPRVTDSHLHRAHMSPARRFKTIESPAPHVLHQPQSRRPWSIAAKGCASSMPSNQHRRPNAASSSSSCRSRVQSPCNCRSTKRDALCNCDGARTARVGGEMVHVINEKHEGIFAAQVKSKANSRSAHESGNRVGQAESHMHHTNSAFLKYARPVARHTPGTLYTASTCPPLAIAYHPSPPQLQLKALEQ